MQIEQLDVDDSDLSRQAAEAERKRRELLARMDFKAVAATAEGRRFLQRLLDVCGVDMCSFIQGDAQGTAFMEGKRSIGLWVQALFSDVPECYARLVLERLRERRGGE